jgi:hypothetical protein
MVLFFLSKPCHCLDPLIYHNWARCLFSRLPLLLLQTYPFWSGRARPLLIEEGYEAATGPRATASGGEADRIKSGDVGCK